MKSSSERRLMNLAPAWLIVLAVAWAMVTGCGGDQTGQNGANKCQAEDNPLIDCRILGCDEGLDCLPDENACRPSSCSCDVVTGSWTCTADCGPGYSCQAPTEPQGCEGEDPSLSCQDTGCTDGQICVELPGECRPGSCFCDEDTGSWGCTADCQPAYGCEPPPITSCEGPDPSVDCRTTGCQDDEACIVDPAGCLPSSCFCDDGHWICTEDCNELFICAAVDEEQCDTPDPSMDCRDFGCTEDGQACMPAQGCRPSSCACTDGTWLCTRDCQELHTCQDTAEPVCDDPDPSEDCLRTGCDEGYECVTSTDLACRPSSCHCTESGWVCTRDCHPYHVCEPPVTCETPNPAGCTQDGCDANQRCIVEFDVCAPSRCDCVDGTWLCTRDCGGGGTCQDSIEL